MKCLVYCISVCCFLVGLFVGFLYLMTVVDPGLLEVEVLRERAAAMAREDRGELPQSTSDRATTLLPSDDYLDGTSLFKKLWPNITRPLL